MSDFSTALRAPQRQLRWLVALWLAQTLASVATALPLLNAAEPLTDQDFFEPGAMILSELVLVEQTALIAGVTSAMLSGSTALFLLGLLRYELTRRIARDSLEHLNTPAWWLGAGKYYGIGIAQGLGLALLGLVCVKGSLRFYRDTGGIFPVWPSLGATVAVFFLLALALAWSTACDIARVSIFRGARTTDVPAAQQWILSVLRLRLPQLISLKGSRLLLLLAQTWLVLELTSPAGSLVQLGAFGGTILVQLLVFTALWLDAAWVAYLALKLNRSSPGANRISSPAIQR